MRSVTKVLRALFFAVPFLILNAGNALAAAPDDYTPEVTARVARISFLSGSVQIKRADQTEWERATQNLPIVEGDELATDADARLEIQFNSESYLRMAENAYLKVTTLRDEGIAVSLPNGSLNLRLLSFDKSLSYFEIDAPQTTVSIEKAGMYRVDAGSKNDDQVRVSVTDLGQARVYSENSGFTLKNGRSATVQLTGDFAGEWETADAAKYADAFDSWTLQRDAVVAKRLKNADYDKYYDRDFYGAEDLNEYGEWIYTKKYGYVWRPDRDSTAGYADWSPYRYGQWRWVPPYGWTWVNDEPWGWATYHHGRWVYDNGGWYWTPYSQYRARRSWWHPALVILSSIGSSICWYPLPYDYGYYNYNWHYYDRRRYNTTIINTTTVVVNPTPTPTPVISPTVATDGGRVKINLLPPAASIPATGVVSVPATDFGTGKGNFRIASVDLAKKALSETPSPTVKPVALPTYKDLNGRVSKEISVENPKNIRPITQIKTGATERTSGVPVGENLRKERILGNRPPLENNPRTENSGGNETSPPIRNTGAVKRQPRTESSTDNENPLQQNPRVRDTRNSEPVRVTDGDGNNRNEVQAPNRPRRGNDNREVSPPREERIERPQQQPPRREERPEPSRQEPIRQEPPREQPRVEVPTRVEPRQEQPRQEQPRQEPPRQEPPRQEPQVEKPAPPSEVKSNRDGRR